MSRPRGICMTCGQRTPLRKDGTLCQHYPAGGGPHCSAGFRNELPLERWLEMMERVDYKRPERIGDV